MEDYQQGNKGRGGAAPATPAVARRPLAGARGSQPVRRDARGPASPFGGAAPATAASPFGASPAARRRGEPLRRWPGNGPFGQPAAAAASPFGGAQPAAMSPFGQPAAASPSPFGGGATPSPFGGGTTFGGGAAPTSSRPAAPPFGGSTFGSKSGSRRRRLREPQRKAPAAAGCTWPELPQAPPS